MTGFFGKTYNKSRMSPPVNAPMEARPIPVLLESEIYKHEVFTPHVKQQQLPGVSGGIRDLAMPFAMQNVNSMEVVPNQQTGHPETILVLGSVSR